MAEVNEFSKEIRLTIGALLFGASVIISGSYVFYDLQTLEQRMDKRYKRHEEDLKKLLDITEQHHEMLHEIEKELDLEL